MANIKFRKLGLLTCALLLSLSAHWAAASLPGLTPHSPDFSVSTSEIIPPYVPQCRSSDGLNLCGPASAALLIDSARCESKKIKPCTNLPVEERASLLDLTRLSLESPEPKNIEKYPREIKEMTPGVVALKNACFNTREIARESCAPFDGFVSKLGTKEAQIEAELKVWEGIRNMYDTYQRKQAAPCQQCALDYATTSAVTITENYKLKTDPKVVAKAFAQSTYAKFLGEMLLPENCSKGNNLISIFSTKKTLEAWPSLPEDRNYESTIKKVKTILETRPIMVGRVCLMDPPSVECGGKKNGRNHTPAIVGYRKMCKANDPKACVELVKVENSLGCGWNEKNNDGWVLATDFFKHTSYDTKNLLWLADASASDFNTSNPGD